MIPAELDRTKAAMTIASATLPAALRCPVGKVTQSAARPARRAL